MINLFAKTKEINFLPVDILQQRQGKKRLLLVVPGIVLVCFALLGLMYYQKYMQGQIQTEIYDLQDKIAVMESVKPLADRRDSEKGQYDKYNTAVSTLEQRKTSSVMLLDGISSVLPPGVYITQMSIINSWGVKITIKVDNALDMARLITGLRSLGWFETVEPTQVPLRGSTGLIQMELPFKGVGGAAPTSPASNAAVDASSTPDANNTESPLTDSTNVSPEIDLDSPGQTEAGGTLQGGE